MLSDSEEKCLTWSYDGTVRIWDAETGNSVGQAMKHEKSVNGAMLNIAETRILTWSDDGTVRTWDSETGQFIGPSLTHSYPVVGATFNVPETHIITMSTGGSFRFWDIGADLDIPYGLFQRQIQVLTGTEFRPFAQEVKCIGPLRWRQLREDYERRAREHYKTCKYPKYNLWRRFHPEEAAKIREPHHYENPYLSRLQ